MSQDYIQAELKKLRLQPENRTCFNCNEKGPGYACMTLGTFVCSTCSGIHREFGHRIKGLTLSTFTEDEVNQLKQTGNAHAKQVYLARWNERDFPKPTPDNRNQIRQFIRLAFIDGVWKAPPNQIAPQTQYDISHSVQVQPALSNAPPSQNTKADDLLIQLDAPPLEPIKQNTQLSPQSQTHLLVQSSESFEPSQSQVPPRSQSPALVHQPHYQPHHQQQTANLANNSVTQGQARLFHQPQPVLLDQNEINSSKSSQHHDSSQRDTSVSLNQPSTVTQPPVVTTPVVAAPVSGAPFVSAPMISTPVVGTPVVGAPGIAVGVAPSAYPPQGMPVAGFAQAIPLPPGALPPPGATVLIPVQTPGGGTQYVQAMPSPMMIPVSNTMYPGQTAKAPQSPKNQATAVPIAMPTYPPGVVLPSPYGVPSTQPMIVQINPNVNGPVPVVQPVGGALHVTQPNQQPMPAIRQSTTLGNTSSSAGRSHPTSTPDLDSDYALALQLQQEEGWPSTPETIAEDEKLARRLQAEEDARAAGYF